MSWNALGTHAEEALSYYLTHPIEFVEAQIIAGRPDEHGKVITLDEKQREAINLLAEGKWPVMQKARGVGGTAIIAFGILWWLYVHPTAKVICTAPVELQLVIHLWPEIKRWLSESLIESDFVWEKSKIFLKGREQQNFAIMQTAAEPERLQGGHDPFLLIVVEEAAGVKDNAFNAFMGSLTQQHNAIMLVYNPTKTVGFAIQHFKHPYGRFAPVHMPAMDLKTGWTHPRVQPEQIENLRREGIDDPYFRAYVLALPPVHDSDSVIPWEWVNEATEMELPINKDYRRVWGIDPAMTGDRVGFCERIGSVVTRIEAWTALVDTGLLVGKIVHAYRELPQDARPHEIVVDRLGVGWGVADGLTAAGLPITPISVSQSPAVKQKFERLRSELWWNAREWFETRAVAIPDDKEFIEELTKPKYTLTTTGKIRVEKKDEFRRRLGRQRSPDKADAFMLTFAIGLERIEEHKVDAWAMDEEVDNGVSWIGAW